ncbi:MAG: MgtC/SapB family protein [Chloroflexi bacterium]|nr:MgtC/SapB family protein [Chloroflexota bacterium]
MAQFEMALRILLAAALGAIIGWQREKAHKPAGLRTHMLIAIGAALFTVVSTNGFPGGVPSQVAAGVVTGIGFLGAGAIMHRGRSVEGLTTAASIWSVAAIGLAAGAGMYILAVLTAFIVFLVLFFRHPETKA